MIDKRILNKREELLGKEFETNSCGKCFIIDYQGQKDVTVIFYDPVCVTKCSMHNLKTGVVSNAAYKNKYPTVYGVGVIGEGVYSPEKDKRIYKLWQSVLQRGYDIAFKKRNHTYKDVTVCDEWLNFQNFAAWCYSQKFFDAKDDKGKAYSLDKDILVKGNKVYSPETCCFVPHIINCVTISCKKVRGNLPIGVHKHRKCNKYSVNFKSEVYLGGFNTPEEAFQVYKNLKEAYIKDIAEVYLNKIDSKVYDKLTSWEVSIDD